MPTSVKAHEAFSFNHFDEAVKTVLVHDFTSDGASLILEACLHEVNGVHRSGTGGCMRTNTTDSQLSQKDSHLIATTRIYTNYFSFSNTQVLKM